MGLADRPYFGLCALDFHAYFTLNPGDPYPYPSPKIQWFRAEVCRLTVWWAFRAFEAAVPEPELQPL